MAENNSDVRIVFFIFIAFAAAVVLLKALLVFRKKGFDLAAFCVSFFRIYTANLRKSISSNSWRRYMAYNNYLNYALYCILAVIALLLLIYNPYIFS